MRELRNLVTRLVLFSDLGLDLPDLAREREPVSGADPAGVTAPAAPTGEAERQGKLFELPLPAAREMVMEQFERGYVAAKLGQHGGNITRAADAMGVSRQLVHRLLDRYGMRAR